MHWFIDPIKNHYADFEGRLTRKPFWMFVLISWIISFGISMIEGIMGLGDLAVLSILYSLILLIPNIAITTRRLHDTGRSGWWQLLWFIPIIGWIVLIVFLAQDTTPADNQYGANPKATAVSASVQPPVQPAQ